MDKLEKYRNIVKQIINEYADLKPAYGEIEVFKFISFVLIVGYMIVFGSTDLLVAEVNDAEILQSSQALMFPRTYLLRVNDVEPQQQKSGEPPLNVKRITGEILAGGLGGAILGGGIVLLAELASECPSWGASGCDIILFAGWFGFPIGYILGNTAGVYIVGNTGNETGSFLATLGGSILGIAGAVAALELLYNPYFGLENHYEDDILIATLFLAGPPIGATVGFNKTRRYKSPPASETALINFRDGQTSFAVPTIYSRPDSFGGRSFIRNVNLVKVRF